MIAIYFSEKRFRIAPIMVKMSCKIRCHPTLSNTTKILYELQSLIRIKITQLKGSKHSNGSNQFHQTRTSAKDVLHGSSNRPNLPIHIARRCLERRMRPSSSPLSCCTIQIPNYICPKLPGSTFPTNHAYTKKNKNLLLCLAFIIVACNCNFQKKHDIYQKIIATNFPLLRKDIWIPSVFAYYPSLEQVLLPRMHQ